MPHETRHSRPSEPVPRRSRPHGERRTWAVEPTATHWKRIPGRGGLTLRILARIKRGGTSAQRREATAANLCPARVRGGAVDADSHPASHDRGASDRERDDGHRPRLAGGAGIERVASAIRGGYSHRLHARPRRNAAAQCAAGDRWRAAIGARRRRAQGDETMMRFRLWSVALLAMLMTAALTPGALADTIAPAPSSLWATGGSGPPPMAWRDGPRMRPRQVSGLPWSRVWVSHLPNDPELAELERRIAEHPTRPWAAPEPKEPVRVPAGHVSRADRRARAKRMSTLCAGR